VALNSKDIPFPDPSNTYGTGPAIPICNGRNPENCTEANEVVKRRLRRPGKRASKGDPDWEQ